MDEAEKLRRLVLQAGLMLYAAGLSLLSIAMGVRRYIEDAADAWTVFIVLAVFAGLIAFFGGTLRSAAKKAKVRGDVINVPPKHP